MAKRNKEEEARRAGIGYAYGIILKAKESGGTDADAIEALRNEMQFRNITRIPLALPQDVVNEWCQSVKATFYRCLKLNALNTLLDEFEMPKEDIVRFAERFDNKLECLDYENADITWDGMQQILLDEVGVRLELPDRIEKWLGVKGVEV